MDLIGLPFRFWLRAQWMKYIKRASYVPIEPLFFIHIPKTAGTSFRNMLFRLIDQDVAFPNLLDLGANEGNYPDLISLSKKIGELDHEVKFLTGHYPFAAGELLAAPRQYYVFLREPVARTISNLLHFQRNQPDCKNLGLWEIFEKHRAHLQNLQTRFLGVSSMQHLTDFFHLGLNAEKLLDEAKTNLEKCTFVGITEEFPTAVKIAEKLLGAKLGYQLKRNVSPARLQHSDLELVIKLKTYLELDLQLYQHALAIFENQKSLILRK